MATANGSYSFNILETIRGGLDVKTGLVTITVMGTCTNPDGITFGFVAANNVDSRYADRFKVNWNGTKPRMTKVAGFGLKDDVQAKEHISENLYFTRGARIAIARMCKMHVGERSQRPMVDEFPTGEEFTSEVAKLEEIIGMRQMKLPTLKELRAQGKTKGITGLYRRGITKVEVAALVTG